VRDGVDFDPRVAREACDLDGGAGGGRRGEVGAVDLVHGGEIAEVGRFLGISSAHVFGIAGLGDLMPPPLLLCVLGGQVVGEKSSFGILKEALIPILAAETCGILLIAYSRELGAFLGAG